MHHDNLGEFEQAAVRPVWEEEITEGIADLNYEERFLAAGESWAEADEHGNVVIRDAPDDAE